MNKKEQIKKLTWKYFYNQKIEEIMKVILIISSIGIFLYIFGKWDFLKLCYWDIHQGCSFPEVFCVGFVNLFVTFLILLFSVFLCWRLYYVIGGWITSNWKKAKEKARKEVKKK